MDLQPERDLFQSTRRDEHSPREDIPHNALPTMRPPGVIPSKEQEVDFAYHFTENHCTDAFRLMTQMMQATELCDVTIIVGDKSIRAHKLVLAATSPYFNAMFTNEMLEKCSPSVEIHDMDPKALESLIEYAYTSQICISETNVQALLPAAGILQMNAVREACCQFLKKQLHPSNCLGIRRFADAHSCPDLLQLSHQFTLHNFVDVCDTEEFLYVTFDDIKDLVCSEELNIVSEEQVYTCVMKWVKQKLDQRKQFVPELLSCIRLPMLTRDFLLSQVETEEIIRDNPACKDLLIEAMKYHLMPEKRSTLQGERTMERRSKTLKPVIFAAGGSSLFAIHAECEFYDPNSDQWTNIASMTTRRSRSALAQAQSKLYAIGGYDGAQDLATAECYNPRINKWSKIASMGTRRSCLGVAAWNGLIYAVGGYDGASCLNSVERYDPLTLSWSSVAAMNFRRRYLKVIVLESAIFAIGGYDGSSHMSSVEKFEPESNHWVTVPNMISRRSNCGVGVLDGLLYVCGGNDGANCLSTVERYNPKRNIWESMASMQSRRSTHDVVVQDGSLYAVGGNDGSTSLNSVERYCPSSNKWTLISPMNLRRSSVGCAIIEVMGNRQPFMRSFDMS